MVSRIEEKWEVGIRTKITRNGVLRSTKPMGQDRDFESLMGLNSSLG